MRNISLSIVAISALFTSSVIQADRVKGSAKADFATDKLIVPCVLVENLDESTNGKYFDIVLDRRGSSFNYELAFAEPEDSTVCETLTNYALFIDDDEDTSDGSKNVDSQDDASTNSTVGTPNLFTECEARPDRSKISVKVKNITGGDYYVSVSSGDNQAQSLIRRIASAEAEFDFDSDPGDIMEGAREISPSFIQNGAVASQVINALTNEVVISETVNCLLKD